MKNLWAINHTKKLNKIHVAVKCNALLNLWRLKCSDLSKAIWWEKIHMTGPLKMKTKWKKIYKDKKKLMERETINKLYIFRIIIRHEMLNCEYC